MIRILIYVERDHPRLKYVANFIQNAYQDTVFEWITDETSFINKQGPKINYSLHPLSELELWIPNTGLLYQDFTKDFVPSSRMGSECPLIFCDNHDSQLGFDVFAAIFWMLSRAEEYGSKQKDQHGRFISVQSLMHSLQSNKFPVVDYWSDVLIKCLCLKFEIQIVRKPRKTHVSLGVDIDQFWKFKHKPFWKNALGLIRDFCWGHFQLVKERMQVVMNQKKDPFDTYDIFESCKLNQDQLYFFILSGGNSTYDKNHSLTLKSVKKILQKLKIFSTICLHPSYQSAEDPDIIINEKEKLEESAGVDITSSRQHYLRFQIPQTFRALLKAGVQTDYSMVYADCAGFRAGTCQPFYWYDLINECQTTIRMIPVITMDRTYLDYEKKSPDESIKDLESLLVWTIQYEGLVQIIWHNSSFDFTHEWQGWENFFEKLISLIKKSNSLI